MIWTANMSEISQSQEEPSDRGEANDIGTNVVAALKTVYDPEIPVNIYDLGLIYNVDISDAGDVNIDMTLTAPGCPVAETFPGMVEQAVVVVEGVNSAHVELVWDPPWTMDRMTEEARLELGLM